MAVFLYTPTHLFTGSIARDSYHHEFHLFIVKGRKYILGKWKKKIQFSVQNTLSINFLLLVYATVSTRHYVTLNDEASAELKRTWRELAKAYFMKYYPRISLKGGENSENPEWAACS